MAKFNQARLDMTNFYNNQEQVYACGITISNSLN